MKRSKAITLVSLCLLTLGLVLSLVAAGWVLAEGTAAIDWWVFGGGGGPVSSGGEVTIDATLGQPVIGASGVKDISLGAGYWYSESEPTAVRLAGFKVTPVGGDILVEWETATEIDTLGFNLYRSESPGGPYTRLNASLIPSQSPGAPVGAVYTWLDEHVEWGTTYYYWLEDLDIYGVATRHGPVQATVRGLVHRVYLPQIAR